MGTPKTATPPAPATPASTTEAPKRTRTAFSKEKKLGYTLLSILEIFKAKEVAAVLKDDQKAKIAKAEEAAKAIGAEDPFISINARITAIQTELTELQKKPANPTDNAAFAKYVESIKELSSDLDRQVKRKAQITELLGK